MTWVGFTVVSFDFTNIFMSVLPVIGNYFLFVIMRYITVPLTEKHMSRSRSDFAEHVKKTNRFWPY